MQKLINKFNNRHSHSKIFEDFVEIAAITISNIVDKKNFEEREKRYLQIIKNYEDEELNLFAEMMGRLIIKLENDPTDVLGQMMMEMGLGSDYIGQFFTPYHIAELMAEVNIDKDIIDRSIKENGYVSVLEPAVGGGVLMIAFANAFRDLGYNYQTQLLIDCGDIDARAVHMTYLQLSLMGIPARVKHANSLTGEVWGEWFTPAYMLGVWGYWRN